MNQDNFEFQQRFHYDPRKDLIGKGVYGNVYKAIDQETHRDVAIKHISAHDDQEQKDVGGEINILKS